MKKILALILSFIIMVSFSACGRTPSNIIENESPSGTPAEAVTLQTGTVLENDTLEEPEPTNGENEESNLATIAATVPTPAPDLPKTPVTLPPSASESPANDGMKNIIITIGSTVFSAKLYDNDAANALLEQFPLTLNMSGLNGNEKYYYLPTSLPADSRRMGSVNAGDLMLYGTDCLVLFYEDFTTSYSYTTLGTIEDASGLAAALGSGGVMVTFVASE